MAARRYEISLLVLKKIFHSFASLTREIFFNTRREISYLRARHVISSLYICIYIYIYIFFFFLAGTYIQLRHHCGRAEKHVVSPVRDFAIRLITA